ncbi:ATP-dependent DNA helicase RecG [Portibacter marinus]|uniref:ATP-dependent DNA helicase RecG n=1 Tax=Portibacter marinus TaxID=2898660 RepID=UPI001F38BE02|nr:ATP-dependent DNA helicase RecG [Portibacter marinus]
MSHYLDTPIEYLKGIGPARADLLKTEIQVFKYGDFIYNFPFRYIDKSSFQLIKDLKTDGETVQLKGYLTSLELIKGANNRRRLVGLFKDPSGFVELIWFQRAKVLSEILQIGSEYVLYGTLKIYKGKKSFAHPEMELSEKVKKGVQRSFDPVYYTTEKLSSRGLDAKGIRKAMQALFEKMPAGAIHETLPSYLLERLKLIGKYQALKELHFPTSQSALEEAQKRMKFEELFFMQMRLLQTRNIRKQTIKGHVFEKVGEKFNRFFSEKLPFELTSAQKRVIKEIRADLGSGIHMNRLVQGDVGSGKTMVALMCMLIAIDNGFQNCMMAPTEILARQHYASVLEYVSGLGLKIGFLSGNVKGKKRKELLKMLKEGDIDILIGTHALIEDPVKFKNLGLAIIDEQHRFGVVQRAKLWGKNKTMPPHVLVMTATPIPRTLAMTLYGDLDVSIIDELPPGRKEVTTKHFTESRRPHVLNFMHHEIQKGRQIYVVYPLIEESEKLDLQNLNAGYEMLLQYFPPERFNISVVHGKMKPKDKDFEMERFVTGKTHIMVATTVIEVGVNVPNATVMIIENSERFGLSQLHQLRGRVGRGAEQSYCILMTSYKVSKEGKERIQTMVRTNNGFEIAEADMQLRGAGNIEGVQQSGYLDFAIANLATDTPILTAARHIAEKILSADPRLELPENLTLRNEMIRIQKKYKSYSRIS